MSEVPLYHTTGSSKGGRGFFREGCYRFARLLTGEPWKQANPQSRLNNLFQDVQCVRETEILVEQQAPQGVFVCDHAGLVINKLSP